MTTPPTKSPSYSADAHIRYINIDDRIPCGEGVNNEEAAVSNAATDRVPAGGAWTYSPDRLYKIEDVLDHNWLSGRSDETRDILRAMVATRGAFEEELMRRSIPLPVRTYPGEEWAVWGTGAAVGVLVDMISLTPGVDRTALAPLQAAARKFPRR